MPPKKRGGHKAAVASSRTASSVSGGSVNPIITAAAPKPSPGTTAPEPQPKPRKRTISDIDDSLIVEGKRNRQQSARIQTLINTSEPSDHTGPPAKKTKKKAALLPAPRDLPQRINHVANPGAPDKKRPIRCHEQVEAENQRIEEERQREDKRARARQLKLAQMQLDEEEEDTLEEARLLSDHRQTTPSNHFSSDEEDADEPGSPDMAIDAPVSQPRQNKKTTRKLKMKKGELRKSVDSMVEGLRKESASKSQPRGPKRAGKDSAQGLVPNWHARIPTSTKNIEEEDEVVEEGNEKRPQLALGGLSDADVFEDRDLEVRLVTARSSKLRQNNRISIFEESVPPHHPPPVTPAKKAKSKAAATSLNPNSTSKIPHRASYALDTPIKPNAIAPDPDVASHPRSSVAALIETTWSTRILPTAYHALYSLTEPFSDFTKGPALLEIFQDVVNQAIPSSGYVARCDNQFFERVYDRLCEQRSHFGQQALKTITAHLETNFGANAEQVAAYAKWALRKCGPAIFKIPTPIDSPPAGQEGHIPPCDPFESKFIIATLKTMFSHMKRSAGSYGYPKGAIALAAAATERAFKAYTTGVFVRPDKFDLAIVMPAFRGYLGTINKMSERRLEQILAVAGYTIAQESDGSHPELVTESAVELLENVRDDLYIPSSPVRGDVVY